MIPNFKAVISPNVFRSGQPYLPSHWQSLKATGIRTVLKLNYPEEGTDEQAEMYGLHIIPIPMPPKSIGQSIFGAPPVDDAATAVAALCDQGNWPILVHCTHGNDRTGLVVAEFRVVHCGWSVVAARQEMLNDGFHPELIDLDRAWYRFTADHLQ